MGLTLKQSKSLRSCTVCTGVRSLAWKNEDMQHMIVLCITGIEKPKCKQVTLLFFKQNLVKKMTNHSLA